MSIVAQLREMGGPEPHQGITARSPGKSHHAINSDGQHKAIVIIGMLADQIDPSRRPGRAYPSRVRRIILKDLREKVQAR